MEKLLFLSPEWVAQAKVCINESETYRKAARHLSDSMCFTVAGKHPAAGDEPETYFYLGIKKGCCEEAAMGKRKADFLLNGKVEDWRAVVDGRLDVMKAIIKGRIKMKGNMLHMVKNARPTLLLVGCIQAVPTRYE